MDKYRLIKKVSNVWTDNIYIDIVDIIKCYTLEYNIEEEAEIVDAVIANMIEIYKS